MTSIKNVILIGAGGNLGSTLLHALTSSPEKFHVSVLSREISSYVPPAGIQQYRTDYNHASLVSAFKGKDAVVSAIYGSATMQQTTLIDAAIEAGVKWFIPAQFGTDVKNDAALKRLPLLGAKNAIINYLEEREEKISWTGIETGPFFDWGLQRLIFGFEIQNSTAKIYIPEYHKVKFSVTTIGTIGIAVARSLESNYLAKTRNKDLFIRSFTVSQDEILASLEKATGKEWTRQEVNLDDAVRVANEKLARGDYSDLVTMIRGMTMDPTTGCNFDERGEVANELLDLPKESLDEVVQRVVDGFNK